MSDKKLIRVRKNPYRNKKFTRVVRDFEKQGLEQIKLEELSKNVSMEEIIKSRTKENNDTEIETFAGVFEKVRIDCYKSYYDKYQKEGKVDSKEAFFEILDDYLQTIIPEKSQLHNLVSKTTQISKRIVEHLTGDYQIGIGNVDFEELVNHAETLSSIVAYSNQEELDEILEQDSIKEFANGVVDGAVASELIPSEGKQEVAKSKFENCPHSIKKFFKNSIYNITHLNEKVANIVAHLTKMDREESKELNGNLLGKAVGGVGYALLSGNLIKKRQFTEVTNSKSMLEKIEQEGILHFSSLGTAEKNMNSCKVREASFLDSYLTKNKSFFFAGVPSFEDLLMNKSVYDVMTAVRIKPTPEQIKDLKYRAISDRVVVKDGDFRFDRKQAEIVYFGLKLNKENKQIYLEEITKEEAKDFKVSDEVRNAYHYEGKKSKLSEKAKFNIYGLYAEYKHHQKLLQMEQILRENGVLDWQKVNDKTLVELSDIEQAYVTTKDKSIERRNLMTFIKAKWKSQKQKDKIKEDDKTPDEVKE